MLSERAAHLWQQGRHTTGRLRVAVHTCDASHTNYGGVVIYSYMHAMGCTHCCLLVEEMPAQVSAVQTRRQCPHTDNSLGTYSARKLRVLQVRLSEGTGARSGLMRRMEGPGAASAAASMLW
jgi:hypothetical protein